MLTKNYSWRRLTLALAILAVIACSTVLELPNEVVTALVMAFGSAAQFFFQQHGEEQRRALPPGTESKTETQTNTATTIETPLE